MKGPRREQSDPLSLWNSSPARYPGRPAAQPAGHHPQTKSTCPERKHGNAQGQLAQETWSGSESWLCCPCHVPVSQSLHLQGPCLHLYHGG